MLSEAQLEELLLALDKVKDKEVEYVIEGNPESITECKLKILKKHDVNRISIGVQSFNKSILKSIDRDYDVDIFELIKVVKRYINNINVDFIYGLPNQSFDEVKEDLNSFIKLDINHISIYSLILEQGTMFYLNGVKEISDDLNRTYYDYIVSYLREHGFKRYEVSNFAKPGYESKHNLTYWKDEEYVGLGIGASGYENGIRYKNSSSLTSYLKGERVRNEEVVNKEDDYEYFLICNLRLEDGFTVDDFINKFGFNIIETKKKEMDELIKNKLITIENNQIKCTDEGIALLDSVILKLI